MIKTVKLNNIVQAASRDVKSLFVGLLQELFPFAELLGAVPFGGNQKLKPGTRVLDQGKVTALMGKSPGYYI